MEAMKAKIVTAAVVAALLILLLLLWLCLGPSTTFFILAGIDSTVVLVILFWVSLRYYAAVLLLGRRMSMARRATSLGSDEAALRLRAEYSFLRKVGGLPSKFTYEALEVATDNFQAVLGRGSSGSVFKGILDDGTPVAVKRIEGAEHGDREFRSEVAAIASVQHVSLVRLLGYCLVPGGGGPRYIVYDFVPNGSLDKWIFPRATTAKAEGSCCLPWPLRYRVAVDVARALSYLHHDCRSRVLHLDVKPENILLDQGFRAVLSDFGLSKLIGRDASRVVVSTVRGTRGYLAPEWLFSLDRGISDRSDVYSYGMVLLEVVGGRRNVLRLRSAGEGEGRWSYSYSYFPRIVAEKVRQGRTMEVVDERLLQLPGALGVEEEAQVRRVVHVALWCIQEEAGLRPSMARVVDMLEGRMPVDRPPESMGYCMIMMDLLGLPTHDDDDDDHRHGGGAAPCVQPESNGEHPAVLPTTSATYSLASMSVVVSPR